MKRLSRLAAMPLEAYLVDGDAQIIAERSFQVAAQCLFDLGNHIIAEQGLGTPEDAHGILDCLVAEGVVSDELFERTRGLPGFRNLLVHDYLDIDHRTVHGLLQRTQDLVDLGAALGAYVDRHAGGG